MAHKKPTVLLGVLACAALWHCGGCALHFAKQARVEAYAGVRAVGPEDGSKGTVEFSLTDAGEREGRKAEGEDGE